MSASYFNNAHDFHVQNLTINSQTAVASKAFDHLHDNIAADARHNSDERCDAPKCYPETRRAVQGEILGWITHGDDDAEPKTILWLTGPAGSGKTAIAGSIAEICEDRGILTGSFFFSSFAGSETRSTKRCLITTLAYCLLQHDALQPLRGLILSAIERDPSIFRTSLSGQCKALILNPLRHAGKQLVPSSLPKIIIIDGLDEVVAPNSRQQEAHERRGVNEDEQKEILRCLLQAARDPHFPFRILIVSRPEPAIRDFFSHEALHTTREVFLDDKYDPTSDIALFYEAKFTEIRRRYRLPLSWPGDEALETLRDRASGQFIYTATVVRFLQTSGMHPQARLDCVLRANSAQPASGATVFSSLDELYTQILRSSPDPVSSTHWIGAIHSLGRKPAFFVRQFLQDYHGQADYLLENVASLVFTPAIEDVRSPFVIHHKSLVDFLHHSERCGSELNDAFHYGRSDFLNKHFTQVLIAKSPTLPVAASEWQAFLKPFLRQVFLSFHPEALSPWEGALVACDVQWWVRTVDASLSRADATSYMQQLFLVLHEECPSTNSRKYSDCRPLCKSWRSNILAGCKALGWRVPNAIAFLRERMAYEAWREWGDHELNITSDDFHFLDFFEAPRKDANIPAGPAPNMAGDYESICHLANLVHSRLPEDWLKLYKREVNEGASPCTVLRLEIGRITRELGANIEDVDPYAS